MIYPEHRITAESGIARIPCSRIRSGSRRYCRSLGHAIGDALFYGSVWWSWVFPDAVFGILVGLFAAKYAIKDGGFEKKQIVLFNVVQVVANLAAWVIVAPVLDIVIYAEPANKVFAQGAWACLGNVIIIGILGTLIAAGYSKIGAKSSSLSKED